MKMIGWIVIVLLALPAAQGGAAAECPGGFKRRVGNMAGWGEDLGGQHSLSWKDCVETCAAEPRCIAFVHSPSDQVCAMYTVRDPMIANSKDFRDYLLCSKNLGVPLTLKKLGCWKDKKSRAIPTLEGEDPLLTGNYRTRTDALIKCKTVAMKKGWSVFAVQASGYCSSGEDAESTYKKYGASTACADDGEGGAYANEVYKIQGKELCKLTKIEIHEDADLEGSYEGSQVIGTATGGSCIGSASHNLQLSHTDSVEETIGMELSETDDINWDVSTSVDVEASAKFLGAGGAVTAGATASGGGSHSLTSTEQKSFTKGSAGTVAHQTYYDSPGGAMLFGVVDRYKIDKSNTPIKMYFECPESGKVTKESTMKLKAQTYQSAYFEGMVGQFSKEACAKNRGLPRCINKIPYTYNNFFGDISKVRQSFIDCFADGKGTIAKRL